MTVPWLLDHAPHTPFMAARTAHPPGLSPLDPATWISLDPDFAAQMARRAELFDRVPALVCAELPEAHAPVHELLAALVAHLATRTGYRVAGDDIERPDGRTVAVDRSHPLRALNRLVAEDFCILSADPASGEYRLIAGLLCFPSRWLLSEKIGRPLTVIHDPVPDYGRDLARRVNRVFDMLRPERPLVRVNWLVHATAELHLPLGISDKQVARADPAEGVFLRTERQTLVRLPETGAVVFGIKTSVCPLDALRPDQAAALRRELTSLGGDAIAYRSGEAVHNAAIARLDRLAA
ncbi:MAG: DUF3445 domain-containing protein [Pseudomonadota bacterium]